MLNKAATNDGSDHHHQQRIVIGDILLHTESKITVIPVFIQSLSSSISSLTSDKPVIHRLSPPNSSGTNGLQTIVQCDLKNTLPVNKVDQERRRKSSSTKKLLHMHKVGMALVKEIKSKVIISNYAEPKIISINTNIDNEQRTHF